MYARTDVHYLQHIAAVLAKRLDANGLLQQVGVVLISLKHTGRLSVANVGSCCEWSCALYDALYDCCSQ